MSRSGPFATEYSLQFGALKPLCETGFFRLARLWRWRFANFNFYELLAAHQLLTSHPNKFWVFLTSHPNNLWFCLSLMRSFIHPCTRIRSGAHPFYKADVRQVFAPVFAHRNSEFAPALASVFAPVFADQNSDFAPAFASAFRMSDSHRRRAQHMAITVIRRVSRACHR